MKLTATLLLPFLAALPVGPSSVARAQDGKQSQLAEAQALLGALANREQALRNDTAALREKAATDEQKALDRALDEAIAKQRELLARTQAESRASSGLSMDELQRALDELLEHQKADAGV